MTMELETLIKFIQTVPLFHSLNQEQLRQVADVAEIRQYAAEDVLVDKDEVLSELVILLEGELQVMVLQKRINYEREIARYFPGDCFGAAGVIAEQRSAAKIRALVPSRAIVLNQETIEQLFDSSPAFSRAVCRSLAGYLVQSIEELAATPFVRLDSFANAQWTVAMLPARISRYCRSLAVERQGDTVTVAMVDPNDDRARSFISDVLHEFQVRFVAISEDDFRQHEAKLLGHQPDTSTAQPEIKDLQYVDSSGRTTAISETSTQDVLPRALIAAIRSGASDLHVEPHGNQGRLRLRLDGKMIATEENIPAPVLKQIVTRIKVMSDLDITNIRRPQDGRAILQLGQRVVELRVSITPCQGGEKAVVRIVAPDPYLGELDNLLLFRPLASFAKEIFDSPSGLVLVTGPTGAGKTTTLYAALNRIQAHRPTLNIVTIEDPVEYSLPYATQIQVNRELKLDFPHLLRTVLRQDPDVILVGEIRDHESAAVTVEAANTGHLVLSTLHTHSALESLVRLRHLGVKPYMTAAALKGVLSQKLVPRLYPDSTDPVSEDDPIIQRLRRLSVLPENWSGTLQRGVEKDEGPPHGESGRVAVFELLLVTNELRHLIEVNAPFSELQKSLDDESFFSLARYSRLLLENGIVAPERIDQIFPKQRFTGLSDA
jgi:type II secretory ATPase GspE/PulE/Tfp pilus assembly ATPase PilB-like protein